MRKLAHTLFGGLASLAIAIIAGGAIMSFAPTPAVAWEDGWSKDWHLSTDRMEGMESQGWVSGGFGANAFTGDGGNSVVEAFGSTAATNIFENDGGQSNSYQFAEQTVGARSLHQAEGHGPLSAFAGGDVHAYLETMGRTRVDND